MQQESLDFELQGLLNAERIHRVAAGEEHYFVSQKHIRRWLFTPLLDAKEDSSEASLEQHPAGIRMWRLPDGGLNTNFIAAMRHKVHGLIMARPGIYEVGLVLFLAH